MGRSAKTSGECGGSRGGRGRPWWSSGTSESIEASSGELLLRRAAVELGDDGFGAPWEKRGCQGDEERTEGSGGVAWKQGECSPMAAAAVANRGGGGEIQRRRA